MEMCQSSCTKAPPRLEKAPAAMVAAQEAVVNFEAELQEGLQRLEELKANWSTWFHSSDLPEPKIRKSWPLSSRKMFTRQMGQEESVGNRRIQPRSQGMK